MNDRAFARIETPKGPVSVFHDAPAGRARWGMMLAHGAGTRADHPSLERLGAALAGTGFSVFRFNFPYAEAGRRPPDRAPVLIDAWAAAWSWFVDRSETRGLPRIAGGRSLGGRMATLAASVLDAKGAPETIEAGSSRDRPRISPDGLALFAYPLHPPGRPERLRSAHLPGITAPMLFVSGTRDTMATPELMNPALSNPGNRATMYWIEAADHGFKAPRRSGRTEDAIAVEAAEAAARWAAATFRAGKRGSHDRS